MSVLVAFSGGTDSSLLLKLATLYLPREKILAVTFSGPLFTADELIQARQLAKLLKVRHKVIKADPLKNKNFVKNPLNRCYICKKALFSRLKAIARKEKLNFVLDGSTLSDKSDFRPGELAKKELDVRSPLAEAGLKKADVRRLSKELGLSNWDKPSLACLASRVPYGTKISLPVLKRIAAGEGYLHRLGFKQVRLRHFGDSCSIEVLKKDIPRLRRRQKQVVDKLKKLGYNCINIDPKGYRTGSLNEGIKK